MIKKLLIALVAALMLFLTVISAVKAQAYYPFYQANYQAYYPSYYSQGYDSYYPGSNKLYTGIVTSYYLVEGRREIVFTHDDFNHYDDFVGYKDLDVYYPSEGRIDIIRNPNAAELDTSDVLQGYQTFGSHVYGTLPNGAVYVKHYGDDHAWDAGYDCGYGGYFTPFTAYNIRPVFDSPCQARNACQVRNGC